MKLLLVDDNKPITTMFSKYFKIKGHDVFVANDGHNALQIIENEKFDAILLDLAMPNFSGRDIVEHLHKKGKINDKLIVSLTASSVSDADRDHLIACGLHSVLKKPIDPDELLNYLLKIKPKQGANQGT